MSPPSLPSTNTTSKTSHSIPPLLPLHHTESFDTSLKQTEEIIFAPAIGDENDISVSSSNSNSNSNISSSSSSRDFHKYDGFPLVQSMMATETKRTRALTKEGSKQIEYPKSNTGWIRTLFILEGRALDRILLPWIIVTLNAAVWAIYYETVDNRDRDAQAQTSTILRKEYIEGVLELVLTTTMAFLLVFRLNRSATRFWMARGCWGIIVVRIRTMVGAVLLHGSHNPHHRDTAVRWITAFSIASMNFTRGIPTNPDTVEGILDEDELAGLNGASHAPLHAADKIRFHLTELFGPSTSENTTDSSTEDGGGGGGGTTLSGLDAARAIALADFRTQQLAALEQQLNVLVDEEGALERIRGTPLPMVYVTHLRTWLMLFLLTLPYFWEASLGYAIIPVECLAAFALLGLEGAAAEVEAPFRKDRTNHLDMVSFCLAVLSNVLQQVQEDADRRKATKRIKTA